MFFHCHHYNCFLQKSIVDQAALLDVKSLLTDAGPRALRPARFWADGRVAALEPGQRLELAVDGSYESNGYLAAFDSSTTPR